MNHAMSDLDLPREIEAEVTVGIGRLQLVRSSWQGPIDMQGAGHEHHLQLSLLPSPDSVGCFPDHWGPRRFERLGKLFFFPAGQSVHTKSQGVKQEAIVCQLSPDSATRYLEDSLQWSEQRLQAALNVTSVELRQLLFRIGQELRAPGFASEIFLESLAMQTAVELSRYFVGIDDLPPAGKLSARCLKLISDRLTANAEKPSLAELARLCNMSVRALTRSFRAAHGQSIGDYVAGHRVNDAKRLLQSDMPIKMVAHTVGFTKASNFAAAFVAATGETPSAYRRRAGRTRGGKPLSRVH